MNVGVDHLRAEMHAQIPDRDYPDRIPGDAQGKYGQAERGAGPTGSQEEISGCQADDEQRDSGLNAAALRRHAKGYGGKMEDQISILEHGHLNQVEQEGGGLP